MVASEAARHLVEALVSWTGIDLERGGRRAAVDRFLENRTRALGVSATAYVHSLDGPEHPEVKELVEAFTVGHTWFYRDPEQLELISRLIETELHDQQPVQVWVPGCATGEDVYTLAMLAARSGWRGSFLGTDINAGFVERAKAGRYNAWTLRNLPPEIRAHLRDRGGGQFEVAREVRSTVRFGCHNLLDPPAPSPTGAWNIILCRNVLIYFRPAQTLAAIEQLGRALASNGWLFLGASDAISTTLPGVRQIALEGRSALRRATARPKGAAGTGHAAARPKGAATAPTGRRHGTFGSRVASPPSRQARRRAPSWTSSRRSRSTRCAARRTYLRVSRTTCRGTRRRRYKRFVPPSSSSPTFGWHPSIWRSTTKRLARRPKLRASSETSPTPWHNRRPCAERRSSPTSSPYGRMTSRPSPAAARDEHSGPDPNRRGRLVACARGVRRLWDRECVWFSRSSPCW